MRVWYTLCYLGYVLREVIAGSWRVARATWRPAGLHPPGTGPAIVEFPLACRSDLEVSILSSCITITPGTLVVGTAAALAEHDVPPTLFVHAAFGGTRADLLSGLRELESRLLRATRDGAGR